jgi:large subunit ribosomal protein L4
MNLELMAPGGEKKGQVEVPESLFGRQGRDGLLWEAVRTYLANQRQGTAKVKTRAEVSGTGKKPFRQKHTGRARHGSRRTPLFAGGGVCFGPHPRDYRLDMPRKKQRQALAVALSARLAEGAVKVIEEFTLGQPKTKELAGLLGGFGFEGSVLLLPATVDENLKRASRNIPSLTVLPAVQVHTYAVLHHANVVFTDKGLEQFTALAGGK